MFAIRSITEADLEQVFELSQLMNFINLPSDKKILKEMIDISQVSFIKPNKKFEDNLYIFVLEDIEAKKVIGISLIHGKHGTEEEPHFYLKVGQEHKYSRSLNTGFIHGTLNFGFSTDGYTEIGGLVLDPAYRGHKYKLGKALSFARFLYIGLNRKHFTDMIHVELMPPFDSKGKSPLWEAIGRKFLNMEYIDADILSRKNKEFITNLFPKDTIYESLLPINARDAIGKVGLETLPVKRMLESIGFYYTEEVDPFDGGPHYRAATDDISLIKNISKYDIKGPKKDCDELFLMKVEKEGYPFYAIPTYGRETDKHLNVEKQFIEQFETSKAIGFKY